MATETEMDGVFYDGRYPSYDTLPKEQCWIYRETGICVLLMEISSRFWWEGEAVDRIASRVARGLLTLLARATKGPGLALLVLDEATGEPLVAQVVVEEVDDGTVGPRRTRPLDGTAWRLLSPGRVTVAVRAEGVETVRHEVEIEAEGWTRVEMRLAR
jgi:hypothetical protein